jgi:hypothetical protein
MPIEVIDVLLDREPQVIEFADNSAPKIIDVLLDREPQVIEFADNSAPKIIDVLLDREPQVIEALIPGLQGPHGNSAFSGSKTFRYAGDKLAEIFYENGNTKMLAYSPNGNLSQIVHTLASVQVVREFIYGGGFLLAINETVTP